MNPNPRWLRWTSRDTFLALVMLILLACLFQLFRST